MGNKIKSDIQFSTDITLTGRKLFVGIANENNVVHFKKHHEEIIIFIKKYKKHNFHQENATEFEKRLYKTFQLCGFIENELGQKERMFNEAELISKEFITFEFSYQKSRSSSKYYSYILLLFLFVNIISSIFQFESFPTFNYMDVQIVEGILLILTPFVVLMIHELGHVVIAKVLKVPIRKIAIGWYFIHPMVSVQYYGINIQPQRNKILVILGGVIANIAFFNLIILILKYGNFSSNVLSMYAFASLSLAITNMNLTGMTDGYFLFSNLFGVYTIRKKGFSFLKKIITDKKIDSSKWLEGILLVCTLVLSLWSFKIQIDIIKKFFELNSDFTFVLTSVIITFMIFHFVKRIDRV